MRTFQISTWLALTLSMAFISNIIAQGTAFTYQGQLKDGGVAANGIYDFTFQVFDAASGGSSFGGTIGTNGLSVANGLFAVTLDFGSGVFTGPARWLQVSVSTNLAGNFSTLLPRQWLRPSPYAVFAGTSATVTNGAIGGAQLATGAVGTSQIQTGAITAALIQTGQVVRALNNLSDNVTLSSGPNITINTVGNSLQISAPNTGGWGLSGTAGTSPTNGNYIGTADNQPLEFRVHARRGFRLEPVADQPLHSNMVNVVGGSLGNYVAPGVGGATIAGGGAASFAFTGGYTNSITGDLGTIGGGGANSVSGLYNTIAGGNFNTIESIASGGAIAGGTGNRIQYNVSQGVIAGGFGNVIGTNANYSVIGGGSGNLVQGNANYSAILSGSANTIQANANHTFLGGGQNNVIEVNAHSSTIAGGTGNSIGANADHAFIGGGGGNVLQRDSVYSLIAGGYYNSIETNVNSSTIGGGADNRIISGKWYSTIAGGIANTNNGPDSSIGGGYGNMTANYYATIGGGQRNFCYGYGAVIAGGEYNIAGGGASAVGGGFDNSSSGTGATVPGGQYNLAAGMNSFAAGANAKANHDGSFVWADSFNTSAFASTSSNQFLIRASGGVGITQGNTNDYTRLRMTVSGFPFWEMDVSPGATPRLEFWNSTRRMYIDYNGNVTATSFNPTSDRNAKENFEPINSRDVLDKLVSLPLSKWNFKREATKHVGPMAQDFYATFGVGSDDRHIATVDADGVALAAIQGLNEKLVRELKQKESEIAELQKAVAELKNRDGNAGLKERLEALERIVHELKPH